MRDEFCEIAWDFVAHQEFELSVFITLHLVDVLFVAGEGADCEAVAIDFFAFVFKGLCNKPTLRPHGNTETVLVIGAVAASKRREVGNGSVEEKDQDGVASQTVEFALAAVTFAGKDLKRRRR